MADQARLSSVDVVKGVAIILVVLGHVLQGAAHRNLLSGSTYNFTERFIYSFHMPAFFFVAGLFVEQSIVKRGWRRFIADKFRTVLYPYLLWAFIMLALTPLIGRFQAAAPPKAGAYLLGILIGDDSWFLFTFFFVLMLALLTRRISLYLRFVLAVLLSLFWPSIGHHGIDGIMTEFVFLVAGQIVGQKIARIDSTDFGPSLLLMTASFSAIVATIIAADSKVDTALQFGFIPLGLAGTTGLFFLARVIKDTFLANALAWIGEASIGIFLLHPYFQGISRLAITKTLGQSHLYPQILVPTVIATLLPAFLYHLRKQWRIAFLFELPKADRSSSTARVNPAEAPASLSK